MLAQGDYRPKIRVELQSSERLKGKLVGTTDAGLRLMRLRYETKIAKSGSPSGRRQSARRFERQDTETLHCAGRDSHDPAQTPQDDPLQEPAAWLADQAFQSDLGRAFSLVQLLAAVT